MRNCFCNNNYKEEITKLKLCLPNDIILNNELSIYFCEKCYFYFSDSGNNQEDYNNYYKYFNNYSNEIINGDKEDKCANYLNKYLTENITVLNYGCGNGLLSSLLNMTKIDEYDIGMEQSKLKYNCIILSHVLEHIYNLNDFIKIVEKNLNDDGIIYIEVPNSEYYDKFNNFGILQEINIEHINFFSKYALSKFMMLNNYISINIIDDYFMLNNNKYYVIRGLFKKNNISKSFENYLNNGIKKLNEIKYDNVDYIYGCGQLLFKILNNFNNIINIVDDKPYYLHKNINNIEIINYDILKNKIKDNDTIFIASSIHKEKIIIKLKQLDKKINIIELIDN